MSLSHEVVTPEELLIRARDALTDLSSEKKALEEKCHSLEQSLLKSAASEASLSSALSAARAEAESTQNVLEDRERETLALRDLVSSLREHLRATKTELEEKRSVAAHADERSLAADQAKLKFESEEAKLRVTLGQWLNAVYSKFVRLVKNTSSFSSSSSSLPPPPQDLDKALSWLDHLPDVSESFKLATAATSAHLETKFAEALGACGKLSARLEAVEREERRGINAMMAVMDSANRTKEETESASAALLEEVHRLKISLADAEALCTELESNNKTLARIKTEAEVTSRMHLEAKEGMERGVLELQHAWQARDAGMRHQIALLEREIAEREKEAQSHASRAAVMGRRLEHVQNVALPTQTRALYSGEIERVSKLVRSAESISRGLRTHFERVHQFFKVHHSGVSNEPAWLQESRTEMINELNAALFIAETADAASNTLSRNVNERVESAIEQAVFEHQSTDAFVISPSSPPLPPPSSSSSADNSIPQPFNPSSSSLLSSSSLSSFTSSLKQQQHHHRHPSHLIPPSSSSTTPSNHRRLKNSGMASFVSGGRDSLNHQ